MKRFGIATLIGIMIMALALAGCGGGGDDKVSAKEILQKSQDAAETLESFTATGSAQFQMEDIDTGEVDEADLDYSMKMNRIDDETYEAEITLTEKTSGEEFLIYMMEDYAYVYYEDTWVKQPIDEASSGIASATLTPDQISDMSKYAEDLEKGKDDGDDYVISYDIGSGFFSELLQAASDSGITDSELLDEAAGESGLDPEMMLEAAEQLLSGLNLEVTMRVNKDTYYVSGASVRIALAGNDLFGSMNGKMEIKIKNINKPVDIELPDEALDAIEIDPSDLDSIPGFYF